jgi:hypothetical protein
MTLGKIRGRIVKIEEYHWSPNGSLRAQALLNEQFKDAPCAAENIQEMLDVLIPKFGNDKTEIERLIIAHYMGTK